MLLVRGGSRPLSLSRSRSSRGKLVPYSSSRGLVAVLCELFQAWSSKNDCLILFLSTGQC